jgi:hypothetical protein
MENSESRALLGANDQWILRTVGRFQEGTRSLVRNIFPVDCLDKTDDITLSDVILGAVASFDERNIGGSLIFIKGGRPMGTLRLLSGFSAHLVWMRRLDAEDTTKFIRRKRSMTFSLQEIVEKDELLVA